MNDNCPICKAVKCPRPSKEALAGLRALAENMVDFGSTKKDRTEGHALSVLIDLHDRIVEAIERQGRKPETAQLPLASQEKR